MDFDRQLGASNKNSLKNNSRTPAILGTMKNLMRSLTTWLEDSYCSIAVANHRLIIINRFITKSYIHLWKSFVNKFYLVLHAEPNMFHDEPNRACLRFILTRPWSNWVFSFENFKLNLFIMSSQRERERVSLLWSDWPNPVQQSE